jgi:hypothetical protein
MQLIGSTFDFSRPTNLNYFVFQSTHMYFMSIMLKIEESIGNLFIQLPD